MPEPRQISQGVSTVGCVQVQSAVDVKMKFSDERKRWSRRVSAPLTDRTMEISTCQTIKLTDYQSIKRAIREQSELD